MKIFALGLCIGLAGGLWPFLMHTPAHALYPEWEGTLEQANTIATSPFLTKTNTEIIPLRTEHAIIHLTQGGKVMLHKKLPEHILFSMSAKGDHFITYEKLGTDIIFYNSHGEQFWKRVSRQYPRISANGKLLLLLVADLSALYIFDYNGNPIGAKKISGRICTTIAFSECNDHALIGFLNGMFYVLNNKGEIRYQGFAPGEKPVKSIAISSHARYAALHYGDTDQDGLSIINLHNKEKSSFSLPNTHTTKTALHVTDNGTAAIINKKRFFIITHDGVVIKNMSIPLQQEGHARISYTDQVYAISYRTSNGGSFFFICKKNGDSLLQRAFTDEPCLDTYTKGTIILARGLHNLFCWSFE
jgi:hypothetical protein